MGSIPQGVFAARKIRHYADEEDCLAAAAARNEAKASSKEVFDNEALEPRPLKYNSKLMNSIWGLYNRYSVHNFKQNTDDAVMASFSKQQCQIDIAASTPAPAEVAAGNPMGSAMGIAMGTVAGGGALGANNAPPVGGAINYYRPLAFVLRTI